MILSPNLPKDFFFVITKTDLSSSILKLPLDRVDLCVKGDDLVLGGHPVFDVSDFFLHCGRHDVPEHVRNFFEHGLLGHGYCTRALHVAGKVKVLLAIGA